LPRLPRPSGLELARALERAGFARRRVRGDHASYYSTTTDRVTTVQLANRSLPAGTIAKVLKEAGLTGDDLRDLLN
jgi:predicted RNA binding protein YcfA (HicA-like mRNA interferase family)